jgi:hypothetical protein
MEGPFARMGPHLPEWDPFGVSENFELKNRVSPSIHLNRACHSPEWFSFARMLAIRQKQKLQEIKAGLDRVTRPRCSTESPSIGGLMVLFLPWSVSLKCGKVLELCKALGEDLERSKMPRYACVIFDSSAEVSYATKTPQNLLKTPKNTLKHYGDKIKVNHA